MNLFGILQKGLCEGKHGAGVRKIDVKIVCFNLKRSEGGLKRNRSMFYSEISRNADGGDVVNTR